jgi:anti-anti-sigma factor
MDAVDALGSAIQDTLHTPDRIAVVVDLARVTFLDCAGIGALVVGRNTAVSRGQRYTVVNPQRQVRQVLELTGVFTVLTGRHPQPAPMTGRAARSQRNRREAAAHPWQRHPEQATPAETAYPRALDLYAQIAAISRTTALLDEQGVGASGQERYVATSFCDGAAARVAEQFDRVDDNDAAQTHAVARLTYTRGGYIPRLP